MDEQFEKAEIFDTPEQLAASMQADTQPTQEAPQQESQPVSEPIQEQTEQEAQPQVEQVQERIMKIIQLSSILIMTLSQLYLTT